MPDFSRVKLFVMDFDGVHTDGKVITDDCGKESVICSRRDGMGLEILRNESDVIACVISKEISQVVAARCRKLKLKYFQGVNDGAGKSKIFLDLINEFGFKTEETIYMGDDVVDIQPMMLAGIGVAVSDAHPRVKEVASYITLAAGGNGAIREICEIILESRASLIISK